MNADDDDDVNGCETEPVTVHGTLKKLLEVTKNFGLADPSAKKAKAVYMENEDESSSVGPEDFPGTDEESHYMSTKVEVPSKKIDVWYCACGHEIEGEPDDTPIRCKVSGCKCEQCNIVAWDKPNELSVPSASSPTEQQMEAAIRIATSWRARDDGPKLTYDRKTVARVLLYLAAERKALSDEIGRCHAVQLKRSGATSVEPFDGILERMFDLWDEERAHHKEHHAREEAFKKVLGRVATMADNAAKYFSLHRAVPGSHVAEDCFGALAELVRSSEAKAAEGRLVLTKDVLGLNESASGGAERTTAGWEDQYAQEDALRKVITGLEAELEKASATARQHLAAYVGADAMLRSAQERERIAQDNRARAENERIAAEEQLAEFLKPCPTVEEIAERIKELQNVKGLDYLGIAQELRAELKLRAEQSQAPEKASRDDLQRSVYRWTGATFGELAAVPLERACRFFEEAVELFQSAGWSKAKALGIVEYVFSKKAGDLAQELGGVGVTLLAFAESIGQSADKAERQEFKRVLTFDPEHFRKRHNLKHKAGIAVWASKPEDDHDDK